MKFRITLETKGKKYNYSGSYYDALKEINKIKKEIAQKYKDFKIVNMEAAGVL